MSTGSGGGSGTCTNTFTPCGGTATGTWTVKSSCLTVSGDLDLQTLFGLTCPSGQVTGSLQVTGTVTLNGNGTFTDATHTTGMEHVMLPQACLTLSGAPVMCDRLANVMQSGGYYSMVTCTPASAGGCSCDAMVDQMGSLGHATTEGQTDGNFTTSGNNLMITQDSTQYSYCVAGNMLSIVPSGTGPATAGSIVLQSSGSSGSGGATGSGGGAGGKSGSGGASGSGGGKAGASGSGGTNGGGGASSSGGATGSGGAGTGMRGMGPCDIYAAASTPTPCAAAYSMVRALSSKYTGPLYQVRKDSSSTNAGTGGSTMDIGMTADGYGDSAAQDAFCGTTTCTVSILYDQSGNKNDLKSAPAGPTGNGARSGDPDYESTATKLSITAGGHKVYALYMQQYEGYRTPLNKAGTNVPTKQASEGIYELADGTHAGSQCCWDFGNVTTNPNNYHTMNTLFFGTGFWGKGAGSGPWFEGDFEGGVWAGGTSAGDPGGSNGSTANSMNPSLKVNFAFGILKTSSNTYALRMADAATATSLTTAFSGKAPPSGGFDNQGGILLGIGGDNSNNSFGTFYEGAIVAGLPSDDTDLAVLKNVQAVGYKK